MQARPRRLTRPVLSRPDFCSETRSRLFGGVAVLVIVLIIKTQQVAGLAA